MALEIDSNPVRLFSDLTNEERHIAGGKGGTLSQLYRKGYPVPEGLVILPAAFTNDEISNEAWEQLEPHLVRIRENHPRVTFAVRSSAVAEDSAIASFAGQFETVLNVSSDEEIKKAINTVRSSGNNEHIKEYSRTKGLPIIHEMAVIVQAVVPALISGVLFTADPVTGDRNRIVGNYVRGLGDKLVSGESESIEFVFERGKHKYDGPSDLKRFAHKLYMLAIRLERELGGPQDIEWAIADDKVYILQSRPITTMIGFNPITGEYNDSLTGDFVWSCVNVGEAMSVVMTPFTWSILHRSFNQMNIIPGYDTVGNIGGRVYQNSNVAITILRTRRGNVKDMMRELGGTREEYIETVNQYLTPLPGVGFLRILPGAFRIFRRQKAAMKNLPAFISRNPDWCHLQCHRIHAIQDKVELSALATNDLIPYMLDSFWRTIATAWRYGELVGKLRRELTELVGADDADTLLSNVSGQKDLLSSLGPVIGLSRVARGEMDRIEYLEQWGHRGPQETETSIPRPFEDPEWLDRQLKTYLQSPIDTDDMLAFQRERYNAAWERFQAQYPSKAAAMGHRLQETAKAVRLREAVRSEQTRLVWVARTLALRAGDLLGVCEDVFFLTYDELIDLLNGKDTATAYIRARRQTYERYRDLPPYPLIIRGRFDPFQWAADPNRKTDTYDSHGLLSSLKLKGPTENIILGMPGSAGQVEGVVRRIDDPKHADKLETGEILVTSQTNIGWTLLFPRAGGIVTDIGAPLSHAAIVARELGIPAVVNCGDATMRLHTGCRVYLDGTKGIVEILETTDTTK